MERHCKGRRGHRGQQGAFGVIGRLPGGRHVHQAYRCDECQLWHVERRPAAPKLERALSTDLAPRLNPLTTGSRCATLRQEVPDES